MDSGLGRTQDELSTRRGGGTGERAIGSQVDSEARGGFGHSGQSDVPGGAGAGAPGAPGGGGIETSALPGHPHSMHGFKRAIEKQQGGGMGHSGRLIGKVRAANRQFQGGGRHGMHIGGAGAHNFGGVR